MESPRVFCAVWPSAPDTTTGMDTLSKNCTCGISTVICAVWPSAPDTTTGMNNFSRNGTCGISTGFGVETSINDSSENCTCGTGHLSLHNDGHKKHIEDLQLRFLQTVFTLSGPKPCRCTTGTTTTRFKNCTCLEAKYASVAGAKEPSTLHGAVAVEREDRRELQEFPVRSPAPTAQAPAARC